MPRPRTTARDLNLVSDYNDGMSIAQLTDEYGLARQTVYNILHNHGVKMRGRTYRGPQFYRPVSDYHSRLGVYIRNIRYERDLEKSEMAEMMRISTKRLSQIERGTYDIKFSQFVHILRALNLEPFDLMEKVYGSNTDATRDTEDVETDEDVQTDYG